MSGNPNRLDETGVQDRSDRANLARLLRQARIVIVQMTILVQNMHRYREEYREELVADFARSVRQRVEPSNGPSSAASTRAIDSGAQDIENDEQDLWDFFMSLPPDTVIVPPPAPPPQRPHRMNEVVPQSEQRVAKEQEESSEEEWEEHPCAGWIRAPRIHSQKKPTDD